MEEVDDIIIHSLKQIGCDIDDDVACLKQFSTELVVASVARCIHIIEPDVDVPMRLPPSMSARYRVGTSLAKICADIGFRGDIGYQTFLYINEVELRRVFMFLIEKLPKESVVAGDEPLGGLEAVLREVCEKVRVCLSSPWTPPSCKERGVGWRHGAWVRESYSHIHPFTSVPLECQTDMVATTEQISPERRSYYSSHLHSVLDQCPDPIHLPSALIHENAVEVSQELQWEQEWSEARIESQLDEKAYRELKAQKTKDYFQKVIEERLKEVETLREERSEESRVRSRHRVMVAGSGPALTEADTPNTSPGQDGEDVTTETNIDQKLSEEEVAAKNSRELEMLKSSVEQLVRGVNLVEEEIRISDVRKNKLEDQLETSEAEILEKKELYKVKKKTLDLLPDADSNIEKLQSQTQAKLEEIKRLRERMKDIAEDIRNKDDLHKQLKSEFAKMSKDVNRSVYTKRILEIIGNIKKQRADIDKVLIDTRMKQKEINQLTGKLDRIFTATDELIFQDAKRNEDVRKAYKYLAALHQSFGVLVQTVEDTGGILREIRDLEDQIDSDEHKKTESNLQKLTADYKQMKEENQSLLQKLKESKNVRRD